MGKGEGVTVAELIAYLSQMPQDACVTIAYDGAYAGCGISRVFLAEENRGDGMVWEKGDVVIRTDQ